MPVNFLLRALRSGWLLVALPGMLLPASLPAAEEQPEIAAVRQHIEAFRSGTDAMFAPRTVERAEAYLGAAMLAGQRHRRDDVREALEQAEQALSEARQTASTFRAQFGKLLILRDDVRAVLEALQHEGIELSEAEQPQPLIDKAETLLGAAIAAMEDGRLNETRQQAEAAGRHYRQALERMLPALTALTGRMISRAASAGAKRYAPQTLQAARDRAAPLRAYTDGLADTLPEHPDSALKLARRALDLTHQVRTWRKNSGSHEMLVLEARQLRLQLAKALGLAIDPDDPIADIGEAELLGAAAGLQQALRAERRAHAADIERLNDEHRRQLETSLAEERQRCIESRNAQLGSLKEAFRAKLERETFEKKRRTAIAELFRPEEATILANLDGSLIIRLTGLQFAPNRSSIDKKYLDLVRRLKKALEIYGDRTVRIEGHTDNQGDVKFNQLLSLKRAEAVRDLLVSAGIEPGRLKALGYGEVRPIASNEFAKGRAMNRRIDIVIDAPAQDQKQPKKAGA